MYRPKKYQFDNANQQWNFIAKNPFGTMVQQIGEELIATHIPLLIWNLDGRPVLHGHLARHNDQAACIKNDQSALFIFQNSRGYVSPPLDERPEVGTWDYSAVHVHTRLSLMSRKQLHKSVSELTAFFEAFQNQPYHMDELPSEMVNDHLDRIVGFVAEPYKVEGIEKKHF